MSSDSSGFPAPGHLGPFPVDDVTLSLVSQALNTHFEVIDGEHVISGGEFTLNRLLEFLSGYDVHRQDQEIAEDGSVVNVYPGVIYSKEDVIKALINEVLRLRR